MQGEFPKLIDRTLKGELVLQFKGPPRTIINGVEFEGMTRGIRVPRVMYNQQSLAKSGLEAYRASCVASRMFEV